MPFCYFKYKKTVVRSSIKSSGRGVTQWEPCLCKQHCQWTSVISHSSTYVLHNPLFWRLDVKEVLAQNTSISPDNNTSHTHLVYQYFAAFSAPSYFSLLDSNCQPCTTFERVVAEQIGDGLRTLVSDILCLTLPDCLNNHFDQITPFLCLLSSLN